MAKKFTFKKLNATKVKQSAERSASRYDSYFKEGVTLLKLKQGRNNFRVIRNPDMDYWNVAIWVHSYVGSKNSSYLCLKKMKNQPCAICDAADDARRAGDKEELKAYEPRERAVSLCLDRDDEKAGLKVWDVNWSMAKDVDAASDTKKGFLDIGHPDEGFDISITRTGSTKNTTRYSPPLIDRESSPLSEDPRTQDALIAEVQKTDVLDLLKFYKNDYLADILTGKIDEKDEEEDENEKSKPRDRTRRIEYEEEEEPEEEAENEEESDDEENDPPWRGSRRSSRDEGDSEEESGTRRDNQRRPRTNRADTSSDDEDEDGNTTRKADKKPASNRTSAPKRKVVEEEEPEEEEEVEEREEEETEEEAEEKEAARWKRGADSSKRAAAAIREKEVSSRKPAKRVVEEEEEEPEEEEEVEERKPPQRSRLRR